MGSNVPVNAVETTLRIAEALQEHECVGVTKLADEIDLPQSTVFNHLKTLEQNEYVVNEGGSYRLGCRFLKLGAKARSYHDVHEVARPKINRLAKDTGEISALLVEEHGLGVFLHRAEGEQAVHIDSYISQRISLHGAALGKAILASLPRERAVDIVERRGLPALTENTITDRDELFDELDRVAERGIAFDDQERLNGLRSVATPITDGDGTILGAVSIAGPTNRIQNDRFRETFPSKLSDIKNVIELDLAYS
ncbi:IclR family transcriptional regulator [Haloarcula sp. GH36]|uniref:IclR family transcriptional regulator n=1 Tax=Haloarcula montana TaxID=3111776 RepID=UPI002D79A1C0|nr:IclR family transcriptional regulator [Haloarcula sp. GH36]